MDPPAAQFVAPVGPPDDPLPPLSTFSTQSPPPKASTIHTSQSPTPASPTESPLPLPQHQTHNRTARALSNTRSHRDSTGTPLNDPRRFTPTLQASLVGEILALRRDIDARDLAIADLEHDLLASRAESDELETRLSHQNREFREVRRQLEQIEQSTVAALEELVSERDDLRNSQADLRERLHASEARVQSKDAEMTRSLQTAKNAESNWLEEKRALERKLHAAETRAQTSETRLQEVIEAVQQQQQQHQQQHPQEDPFRTDGTGMGSVTPSPTKRNVRRHNRSVSGMSQQSTGRPYSRFSTISMTSPRGNFGGMGGFGGATLADELEFGGAEEFDLSLVEEQNDADEEKERVNSLTPVGTLEITSPILMTPKARSQFSSDLSNPVNDSSITQDISPNVDVSPRRLLRNSSALGDESDGASSRMLNRPGSKVLREVFRLEARSRLPEQNNSNGYHQRSMSMTGSVTRELKGKISLGDIVVVADRSPKRLNIDDLFEDRLTLSSDKADIMMTEELIEYNRRNEEIRDALSKLTERPSISTQTDSPEASRQPDLVERTNTVDSTTQTDISLSTDRNEALTQTEGLTLSIPRSTVSTGVGMTKEEIQLAASLLKPTGKTSISIGTDDRILGTLNNALSDGIDHDNVESPHTPPTSALHRPTPIEIPSITVYPPASVPQSPFDALSEMTPPTRLQASPETPLDEEARTDATKESPIYIPLRVSVGMQTDPIKFDRRIIARLPAHLQKAAMSLRSARESDAKMESVSVDAYRSTTGHFSQSTGFSLDDSAMISESKSLSSDMANLGLSSEGDNVGVFPKGTSADRIERSEKSLGKLPAQSIVTRQPSMRRSAMIQSGTATHMKNHSNGSSIGSGGSSSVSPTSIPPPFPVPNRISSRRPFSTFRSEFGSLTSRRSKRSSYVPDETAKPRGSQRFDGSIPDTTSRIPSKLGQSPTSGPASETTSEGRSAASSAGMSIPSPNDPPTPSPSSVVEAIAATMVGEWMWKYVRRKKSFTRAEADSTGNPSTNVGGSGGQRHRRWVWVSPYDRSIMWSGRQPATGNALLGKGSRKLIVQSVLDVRDDNPLPSQRFPPSPTQENFARSIVILTPSRALKFTAMSEQRHFLWLTALSFLSSSSNSGSLPMFPLTAIQAGHPGSISAAEQYAAVAYEALAPVATEVRPSEDTSVVDSEAADAPIIPRTQQRHSRKRSMTGPLNGGSVGLVGSDFGRPISGSLANTAIGSNSGGYSTATWHSSRMTGGSNAGHLSLRSAPSGIFSVRSGMSSSNFPPSSYKQTPWHPPNTANPTMSVPMPVLEDEADDSAEPPPPIQFLQQPRTPRRFQVPNAVSASALASRIASSNSLPKTANDTSGMVRMQAFISSDNKSTNVNNLSNAMSMSRLRPESQIAEIVRESDFESDSESDNEGAAVADVQRESRSGGSNVQNSRLGVSNPQKTQSANRKSFFQIISEKFSTTSAATSPTLGNSSTLNFPPISNPQLMDPADSPFTNTYPTEIANQLSALSPHPKPLTSAHRSVSPTVPLNARLSKGTFPPEVPNPDDQDATNGVTTSPAKSVFYQGNQLSLSVFSGPHGFQSTVADSDVVDVDGVGDMSVISALNVGNSSRMFSPTKSHHQSSLPMQKPPLDLEETPASLRITIPEGANKNQAGKCYPNLSSPLIRSATASSFTQSRLDHNGELVSAPPVPDRPPTFAPRHKFQQLSQSSSIGSANDLFKGF